MSKCFLCSEDVCRSADDGILKKLASVAPEVDWDVSPRLCHRCEENLNAACEFKALCISSYWSLKNSTEDYEPFTFNSNETFECESEQGELPGNEGVEVISCEKCQKEFKTEKGLKKHTTQCKPCEYSKDEEIKVVPTCPLCKTTFKNTYLLKRHTQNVHSNEKKFKCDECSRDFVSAVYLQAHKKYHSRYRSHICLFCGKGFITGSDLYHHEKIHNDNRDYQCETCPKAFKTSSHLHKHKVCVHSDRSGWKYVCSYCDRRFPLKVNLDTHVKMHTGERNFPCHVCGKRYINKSNLSKHIATHSSGVAFRCEVCTQGYKHKKSLNYHMAKVHEVGDVKVKRFVCDVCQKSYGANSKLQKHIKSHKLPKIS